MINLIRGIVPRSILITADNPVFVGRSILVEARLAAVAADSTAVIYDGIDTAGKKKCTLSALAKTTDTWAPPAGDLFEQGIYFDLSGASAEVTLTVVAVDSVYRG